MNENKPITNLKDKKQFLRDFMTVSKSLEKDESFYQCSELTYHLVMSLKQNRFPSCWKRNSLQKTQASRKNEIDQRN